MQQISIQIPDKQVAFIVELLQKFDFVKIDTPTTNKGWTLTNAQKKALDAQHAKYTNNPNYLLDWDSVKNTLKLD